MWSWEGQVTDVYYISDRVRPNRKPLNAWTAWHASLGDHEKKFIRICQPRRCNNQLP